MQKKKTIFYELNPRYFRDSNADGVGDLQGLASKFDYFSYLNIDAVILQDITSADVSTSRQDFMSIAPELGSIEDFKKVIAKANKFGKKVLIELKLGHITRNNEWFSKFKSDNNGEYSQIIKLVNKEKMPEGIELVKLEEKEGYYAFDVKTQEVPLNWTSESVLNKYIEVIKFWKEVGVSGFVFKDFEFIADIDKSEVMSDATTKELKRFIKEIRTIDNELIIVGRSGLISLFDSRMFTSYASELFDFFISSNISMIGSDELFGIDLIGKFKPKYLGGALKVYSRWNENILSFGSREIGRVVSRWGNDNVYINESSKALAMLLMFSKSSSCIYFGDELGMPNIELSATSDFKDRFIDRRLEVALANGISKREFFDAQILQNPINVTSPFPWNKEVNAGFSDVTKLNVPLIHDFKNINVIEQFNDKDSVLNFYKNIIELHSKSEIQTIMKEGSFKVSTIIPDVIILSFKVGNKILKALVNLSDKNRRVYISNKNFKVLASTYNEVPSNVPRVLKAFEGVIIANFSQESKVSETILDKVDKIDIDTVVELSNGLTDDILIK